MERRSQDGGFGSGGPGARASAAEGPGGSLDGRSGNGRIRMSLSTEGPWDGDLGDGKVQLFGAAALTANRATAEGGDGEGAATASKKTVMAAPEKTAVRSDGETWCRRISD
ncbi:hypothetical protein E2562_002386 [Oryza meyeriana var. granulata]|uniref:Uncharacterized protein n=1 Tax=Oryza meyeriana var. granulata TaxID=110450 RepID=A0A6G1BIN1_9ORYZ|nr:hypothetical protein E2562_002386 [Oryza meyeriana var. granulata]